MNLFFIRITYEYPRSWMLPLLKDFIEKTELQYFVDTMLPLAKKLKLKANQFQHNKQEIEFKIFDNLQHQVCQQKKYFFFF